jgi:hypothetical protein
VRECTGAGVSYCDAVATAHSDEGGAVERLVEESRVVALEVRGAGGEREKSEDKELRQLLRKGLTFIAG